nr:MAG TPA: hypothetical protein [Caudoviricetes sp.]
MMMLRGSCTWMRNTRLRITRLRMWLRISILASASRHPRAPSNSASSSTTFTTRSFYNN